MMSATNEAPDCLAAATFVLDALMASFLLALRFFRQRGRCRGLVFVVKLLVFCSASAERLSLVSVASCNGDRGKVGRGAV
jgi:hypothetical protein